MRSHHCSHFQNGQFFRMLSILAATSQLILFYSATPTSTTIIQGTLAFSTFIATPHNLPPPTMIHRESSSTAISMSLVTKEQISSLPTKQKSPFRRFGKSKMESQKKKKEHHGGIQITFVGKQHVATPPVPFTPESAPLLEQYFKIHKYRELLFPKNNATMLEPMITQELFSTWCNEAELGGATGPTVKTIPSHHHNEKVLQLHDTPHEKYQIMKITALLQMPSLQVRSESLIGVKLILPHEGGTKKSFFPELQFTLLDSQLIPMGSKAARWIFHQIMAYRDSTSSFTRVMVEPSGDNDIVFTTDARLETRIHLPDAILKFLPSINVEKFEEQGSASIQKLLERDLEPALVNFGKQFQICMQDKSRLAVHLELSP